jgi:hypothetical protein
LKITLQQAAVPPLAGFPAKNFNRSIIRSLTPQQAAGNALAVAVQQASRALQTESAPHILADAYFNLRENPP